MAMIVALALAMGASTALWLVVANAPRARRVRVDERDRRPRG